MNIMEKLGAVQQELKAPKDKFNSFGKYSYRSAEGILEAVKPLLAKNKVTMTLEDAIETVGGRVYVKATATMWDMEASDQISTTAYAQEADEKKGMDASQITGTASSYARKYALNGLLLIDDTKDADTDEYQRQTKRDQADDFGAPDKTISIETQELIIQMAQQAKVELDKVLTKPISELTNKQAGALIQSLKRRIGE